jgi:hypothetical protein
MAAEQPPEFGTLVTAALLVLALLFAGYWIVSYAGNTGAPLARWFGIAAVVIVVVAFAINAIRIARGSGSS